MTAAAFRRAIRAGARRVARTAVVACLAACLDAAVAGAQRPAARARPTKADTAAVLAALQSFLDAIERRDSTLARSVLMPESVIASAAVDGGPPRPPRVRAGLDDARRIAQLEGAMLERIWSPTVLIEGPMAVVWAPYDFHVDGRFTHCGVDTATLFHDGKGWRMLSLAYTMQPSGCPPTPLPPPPGRR